MSDDRNRTADPNIDPLKTLWQSQEATSAAGSDDAGDLGRFVRDRLWRELARRRLRETLHLAHALLGATALVVLVSWVLATRPPRRLPLTQGLLALLIPPLGLLAARIASWRAGRRLARARAASVAQATRDSVTALDQDLSMTRAVLLAQLATALLLPPVLWLAWRAGLMRPRDVLAQAGLFYSTLAAVALYLLHRRHTDLVPRRTELRALLEGLRGDSAAAPEA
jgi:hypothetical protein